MSGVRDTENPHAGQGPVVLDIGGDVGALVVSMPSAMEGIEIEISPAGTRPAGHVPHKAVHGRPAGDGLQYTVVYPELIEGSYDLNEIHTQQVILTVQVTGGEITFATWPTGS